jgi:hypothetical protein
LQARFAASQLDVSVLSGPLATYSRLRFRSALAFRHAQGDSLLLVDASRLGTAFHRFSILVSTAGALAFDWATVRLILDASCTPVWMCLGTVRLHLIETRTDTV